MAIKSIDIFNSFDMDRTKKIFRNGKLIYGFIRYGSKAITKVNTATACIEAIISVGEAVVSFYDYQQEKEITIQLRLDLDKVKKELENSERTFKEIEKVEKTQNELQTAEIEKKLVNTQEQWKNKFKPIYEQSNRYLYQCKDRLEHIKKEHPESNRIKDIERKYIEAVEANIKATLFIIGG